MLVGIRDMLKTLTPVSARRAAKRAQFAARLPTSSARVLPDFLIIGAQRAGTSSLFRYLASHPCVIPSLRKEVGFFSRWYANRDRWYRAHFPTRMQVGLLGFLRRCRILTFEATPDYLYHPYAAPRAASLVPNARIIVLLRNPVDRALSHYQHMVRLGHEQLPFEEAIAQEHGRIESETIRLLEDPAYYSRAYLRYSYFSRGMYADQLEIWLKHFPAESFLILNSEDFFARTAMIYQDILEFLGLRPWKPPRFRNYSYLGAGKPKAIPESTMPHPFRQELVQRYVPHNERLFELLGMDLGWNDW